MGLCIGSDDTHPPALDFMLRRRRSKDFTRGVSNEAFE